MQVKIIEEQWAEQLGEEIERFLKEEALEPHQIVSVNIWAKSSTGKHNACIIYTK